MKLSEVAYLKAGDIIPVEMPESVLLLANGVPTFRGKLGESKGNLAVKITEKVPRPDMGGEKGSRLAYLREQVKKEREEAEGETENKE